MVLDSLHPFDDVNVSFTRHDQGRNWRRVIFNQEVWLLFLGLHLDYWDHEFIETVLAPFARIIDWYADDRRKVRVLQELELLTFNLCLSSLFCLTYLGLRGTLGRFNAK